MHQPLVIIIMGVSGSGKTTVGSQLAASLQWRFIDADDDHSPENVQRMRSGQPLTDAHRGPWLARLTQRIEQWLAQNTPTVLACSALTRNARRTLRHSDPRVQFVYLRGNAATILRRLQARKHFMPPSLLQSQMNTLQEPSDDEHALTLDATQSPDELVQQIRTHWSV